MEAGAFVDGVNATVSGRGGYPASRIFLQGLFTGGGTELHKADWGKFRAEKDTKLRTIE